MPAEPDPRDQPGPAFGERVGLFTVLHPGCMWALGIAAGVVMVVLGWWAFHG